jgi:hypothetical protein
VVTLPLEGDLHHPQGLSPRASGRDAGWWVTTVDLAVLDEHLALQLLLPMPDRSPADRPVTYDAAWCEPTASGSTLWAWPDGGQADLLRLDLPI